MASIEKLNEKRAPALQSAITGNKWARLRGCASKALAKANHLNLQNERYERAYRPVTRQARHRVLQRLRPTDYSANV